MISGLPKWHSDFGVTLHATQRCVNWGSFGNKATNRQNWLIFKSHYDNDDDDDDDKGDDNEDTDDDDNNNDDGDGDDDDDVMTLVLNDLLERMFPNVSLLLRKLQTPPCYHNSTHLH